MDRSRTNQLLKFDRKVISVTVAMLQVIAL